MSAPFDSFRTARWIRTINLVLQALLILTLVGGLNYLARNHPLRYDLTRYHRFSLSPETLSYIKNLHQPVNIYVTQGNEEPESPEIRGLLEEYKIATEGSADGRISVKYINVFQDRREAERLVIDEAGVVVLTSGDRRRAFRIDEFYKVRHVDDPTTTIPGATVTERVAFHGEQDLTAAILDVSSPDRKKIYFVTGHSELSPLNPDPALGLSDVKNQLRIRNFDVDTLDLVVKRSIPVDASLLIITAPQTHFTAKEQEELRNYLGARAGRLLLFLAPGMSADQLGLNELLLDDWGILVDDDYILDVGANNITEDAELLIRPLLPAHPVSQALINTGDSLRLGAARSVRPDPGRAAGNGITTVTLAATSPTAWGLVSASYRQRRFKYTPGVDIRPLPGMEPKNRLGIIVASERVAVRQGLAFSVRGGRIVVFGTGDLIANKRIADAGNQNIFLGAVNWTVDRDTQLSIPARPIERFQLSLSAGDLAKLRYALLFAVPGFAAFLGLIVYWTRRH